MEQLSGLDLSSVRVRYNSAMPKRMGAVAVARGREIELAPGAEGHLGHEAWHTAQQLEGRVRPTTRLAGMGVNGDYRLEREADAVSRRASAFGRVQRGARVPRSPRGGSVPTQAAVAQLVVAGLEHIVSAAQVPDDWVDLYVQDVTDDHAHLWDEDIITYLDVHAAGWHDHATAENTGGNHWDVVLQPNAVRVRTAADGNCGCHAIHAVMNRQQLVEKQNGYRAPAETITAVRLYVQGRVAQDPEEVKKRIAFEVQRSPYAALTGFGPRLLAEVFAREREAHQKAAKPEPLVAGPVRQQATDLGDLDRFHRLVQAKVPAAVIISMMREAGVDERRIGEVVDGPQAKRQPSTDRTVESGPDEAEALRQRLAELERELMDLYMFEIDEGHFLKDMKAAFQTHYAPKQKALAAALKALKEAQGVQPPDEGKVVEQQTEVTRLQQEWDTAKAHVKKSYERHEKESNKRIAASRAAYSTTLSTKRQEWMALMEPLSGAHATGASASNSALRNRHDLEPGHYGRAPTKEDELVGHRHMEVLHGHGAWHRSGLAFEGSVNPEMKGLTSLGEILAAANEIRIKNGLPPLAPGKVDLAFVGPHGIGVMGNSVAGGAYPAVMPLPTDLHRKVLDLLAQAKATNQDPEAFIRSKTTKEVRNKKDAAYAAKRGWEYKPEVIWTDPDLWQAFKRVVEEKSAGGRQAQYTDVLNADTHGDVHFPDLELHHLMGLDQNTERMRKLQNPDYKVNILDDFKTATASLSEGWFIPLSRAMTERLAEIEVGDQPVRVVWAACRSEHWPKGFNDVMFNEWIRTAAEQRRKLRGW